MLLVLLRMAEPNSVRVEPIAQQYAVKACQPKVVQQRSVDDRKVLRVRKEDHPTGFSPIISYQILETGEVAHAQVKRSSGVAEMDSYALRSIQRTRFNRRPGCGIIDANADVTIDFR